MGRLTAVSIVGCVLLVAQPAAAQNGAKSNWLGSLEDGQLQARETGKPLMVVLRCVP